jgi:hypothetical protein
MDLRWDIPPDGCDGGTSRVPYPSVPSPFPSNSIDECLFFHLSKNIRRNISIATPATPPTTPPTTTGVDTGEVELPSWLEAAVLVAALPAPVPDPATMMVGWLVLVLESVVYVCVYDDELGEYAYDVEEGTSSYEMMLSDDERYVSEDSEDVDDLVELA